MNSKMKRLIYISLLCWMPILFGMDALWIEEEDQVSLSSFTTAVHQRYYFIARLEPVHNLIKALHCSCVISVQDFESLTHIAPQHPKIIDCIAALQQSLTCDALLELWHEVTSYKYLTNDQFAKEYTTLVALVSHQLVTLMHDQLSPTDQKILASLCTRAPKKEVSSTDVTFRYYLLKRLKKVHTLLRHCAHAPCVYTITPYLGDCTDRKVLQCAQDIEACHSLEPLLQLLREVEQFQSIENVAFIHELLQLILVTEQHALAPFYLPRKRELCAHYEHEIEGLSLEEILKSIDILTAHIEPYAHVDLDANTSWPVVPTLVTMVCSGIAAWYALH